jgi:hypothetical protein
MGRHDLKAGSAAQFLHYRGSKGLLNTKRLRRILEHRHVDGVDIAG